MTNLLNGTSSRDLRQREGIKKWLAEGGQGTLCYPTGLGKTMCALIAIQLFLNKYPDFKILVIVPTTTLKEQWIEKIDYYGFSMNVEVVVVNTAVKNNYVCDLLILDEEHRYASDQRIVLFDGRLQYKYILGLSATFERLDGRDIILKKFAPVVDRISLQEAQLKGWIANYSNYLVIINVDNIDEYLKMNKEFISHFEYFGFDWSLVMSMIGPKGLKNRLEYRDRICKDESKKSEILKEITYHAVAFMKVLQNRKAFINNHPDKIKIAEEIIAARDGKKIITFSGNIKMAESFKSGFVFTGKNSKKKNRITIEKFNELESGILHTSKLADEGLDCAGLSVGIALGIDSSKTRMTQRKGRVIRKEGNKFAEFFTLIINNTVETQWFSKANEGSSTIILDVENLRKLLNGEAYETYKKPIKNYQFRF